MVEDILFRPSQLPELKSYILVKFDSVEGAMKVKNYYLDLENGVSRRKKLGGTSLEMNILCEPQEAGNSYSIIKPNILKYLGENTTRHSAMGKQVVIL